jgi:hypothetical protein
VRVTEKARQFGPAQSLLGIVSDPPEAAATGERPALILLNAGTLHHVGPNRVHVRLARRLAGAGFVAMRFDFSGIGDSPAREDGMPFAAGVLQEAREAMDLLARTRGVARFALFGICSGADNALRVACSDPRVTALVLVDPYNLPSTARVVHMYASRMRSLRSWGRLLSGQSQVWSSARTAIAQPRGEAEHDDGYAALLPTPEQFVHALKSVADRGVQVDLLYTGESAGYVQYRQLLRKPMRRWPSRGNVRVEYLPHADHVFTPLESQRRLVDLVEGRMRRLAEAGAALSGRPGSA